jgi:hypothetical protein
LSTTILSAGSARRRANRRAVGVSVREVALLRRAAGEPAWSAGQTVGWAGRSYVVVSAGDESGRPFHLRPVESPTGCESGSIPA